MADSKATYPSVVAERFQIRLPEGLRNQIKDAAAENGRSMNSEILARLFGDAEALRDRFAGQALAGLVGNPGGPFQASSHSGWDIVNCDVSDVAATCYRLADAMLAARKGGA